MGVLVKLPKIDLRNDIEKLRKSFSCLEISLGNKSGLGVETTFL